MEYSETILWETDQPVPGCGFLMPLPRHTSRLLIFTEHNLTHAVLGNVMLSIEEGYVSIPPGQNGEAQLRFVPDLLWKVSCTPRIVRFYNLFV